MISDCKIKLKYKKSKIHNIGVFSDQFIKKNTLITRILGDIYNKKEYKKLYKKIGDKFLQIDKNFYLGPKKSKLNNNLIDEYLNHSCNPNCGIIEQRGKFYFKSIKDIKVSEELTWDYSTSIEDDDEPEKCNCNSDKCRNKIESFSMLPNELQKKYLQMSVVLNYIIKKNDEDK